MKLQLAPCARGCRRRGAPWRAPGLLSGLPLDGNLGIAGERGHLVQRQLLQLLAVVELGRGGHAVGAVAEEALVEVQLEDLVLAELVLHAHRQQHLGELAGVAVFRLRKNWRATCWVMVEPPGTRLSSVVASSHTARRDAFVIDAVVLVEAGVLDGDEGLLEPLRHRPRCRPDSAGSRRTAPSAGRRARTRTSAPAARRCAASRRRGAWGRPGSTGRPAPTTPSRTTPANAISAQRSKRRKRGIKADPVQRGLRVSWARSIEEAGSRWTRGI